MRRPIPAGPLWPWLKVAEDVATELGHVVSVVEFGPYSGLGGTFLRVRFAGEQGFDASVCTDSEVIVNSDVLRPYAKGWFGYAKGWFGLTPKCFVSTPDELGAVLRMLAAQHPRPAAEWLGRLERQRLEID